MSDNNESTPQFDFTNPQFQALTKELMASSENLIRERNEVRRENETLREDLKRKDAQILGVSQIVVERGREIVVLLMRRLSLGRRLRD